MKTRVWVLADDRAGNVNQLLGVAEALGWAYERKDIRRHLKLCSRHRRCNCLRDLHLKLPRRVFFYRLSRRTIRLG